jgi:hypothetical protein
MGPYNSVEVLVVGHPANTPNLANFPSLRILSTYLLNIRYNLSRNPAVIQNLTHLRLPPMFSDRSLSNGVVFPNLHTFCIDFFDQFDYRIDNEDEVNLDDLDFLNWSLPNLVNLGCFGEVIEDWMNLAIYELIEKFGPTLQGVYMAVHEQDSFYRFYKPLPENIWRRCPLLKTIYTALQNLEKCAKPPEGHSPLRLVFCDIDAPEHWRRGVLYFANSHTWDNYTISSSLLAALGWQVEEFQIDISWQDLRMRIDALLYDDLEMIYGLLDRLRSAGRDLKDRNGNGMKSEQGKEFTTWMETTRKELIR